MDDDGEVEACVRWSDCLRDVERHRCWKRGSGDGQRLWDYFTARLSDLQFNAVDKRGSTLT